VVQVVGLVVGLGLLAWALSLALGGDNREALQRLRHASAGTLLALAGLTALSVVINGVAFWATLRPLRRIPLAETIGVNAIATFLSVLPFKIGLVARSLLHMRRHGVPMRELLAWYVAFAGLTGVTMVITGAIGAAPGLSDAARFGLAAAALVAVCVATPFAARWIAGVRVLRGRMLGLDVILARPSAVWTHVGLRLLDIATFGLRFWLIAGAVGVPLSALQALKLGGTYLFIQATAPAGTLGFAEAGTAGAGDLIGLDAQAVVLMALIATAAQLVVAGAMALLAAAWLRPWQVVVRR
jgi:hypothetical protein